jgi:hypothetical protein
MTLTAAPANRTNALLYLLGIVLSAPPLISLIHRQWDVGMAPDIEQLVTGYRSLSAAFANVIHAPLRMVSVPTPPPLVDIHILSFAGMGMMTLALETPGAKKDAWHAAVWSATSFLLAWFLMGILVLGGILALILTRPLLAFRSDHYIETTPVLEGPKGRLRREREMRLERDLARVMLISLLIVGGYFALNALLLPRV